MARHPLLWVLVAGAAVRLLLWFYWRDLPLNIDDEQSYDQLARGLLNASAYVDEHGHPTSLRPPLYPFAVALIYSICGGSHLGAVRAIQAAISMLTIVATYRLGRIAFGSRVGLWGAASACFYPSLLGFNNLVLSETLFTFLLVATTLVCVEAMHRGSFSLLIAAGTLLGLAALTRSIMVLFAPLLAMIIVCSWRDGGLRRWLAGAVPVAAVALVIAPWSYRNSRLQETFVVIDVMGGRNAMMGNYEYTPLERSWATISLVQGERAWHTVLAHETPGYHQLTQGQRDKLALRHAVGYVLDHPLLTAKRDLVKFFNFWQLERSLLARAKEGFFGQVSGAGLLVASCTICGSYAAAILLGIFGLFLCRPVARSFHWLFVAQILFPCAIHTLVFAHERYHLPIMPFVLLYAAAACLNVRQIWQRRCSWSFWLAVVSCAVLVLAWLREMVFVDFANVVEIVGH
ncbi:MAG: glycosyltransferase family 39 protein [Planctomycetes bacterium]|nr:glycosyltransferase family 39 protein [Planctomycetota bacterium]